MHYPIIFLFKFLAYFLGLLPQPVFQFCGRRLGDLLRICGFRRHIIDENLTRAFPQQPAAERTQLIRANYYHYGILFLEFLQSFGPYERFIAKSVEVEGGEHLAYALTLGKGALVFTAHLGNWELLPVAGGYILGHPVTMVTKHLKPEWLHKFVESERNKVRVKMAFEPRTMPIVLRALKNNEVVGFVVDQYMGAPFAARVPFFGVPVGSQIALATIAARTGAAVLPAYVARMENGKYKVKFEAPLPLLDGNGDRDRAVIENTAKYVKWSEERIRQYPAQWLWIHRRWKGDLSPLPQNSVGEFLK
jgi:Kdo2-lipid IVA lauroyltransferase/acyltransferase